MDSNINDTDSILISIKKLLGISEDYKAFDSDIVMHINSVLLDLQQIGAEGIGDFSINNSTIWTDLMPSGLVLNSVKSYMYLKVKLMFDPPASSVAVKSIEKLIDRYEWRINFAVEEERRKLKK